MAIVIGEGSIGSSGSGGNAAFELAFPLIRYYGAPGLVNTLFNKIYGKAGNSTQENIEAVADVGRWQALTFLNPADYNAKLAAVGGDIFKLLGQTFAHPIADAEGYIARYSDVLPWIAAERNAYSAAYPNNRAPGAPTAQERRFLAYKHYQDFGRGQGRIYAPVWPVTYTVTDGNSSQRQVSGDWVDRVTISGVPAAMPPSDWTGSSDPNYKFYLDQQQQQAGLSFKTLAIVGIAAFFLFKGK